MWYLWTNQAVFRLIGQKVHLSQALLAQQRHQLLPLGSRQRGQQGHAVQHLTATAPKACSTGTKVQRTGPDRVWGWNGTQGNINPDDLRLKQSRAMELRLRVKVRVVVEQ